jgi:hypothetical protein
MKLVLDAQQDFIKQSAANEPSFAAAKKDGEFQMNFQFGDFVTKLKEIASSFKNNVSDGPLGKAVAGQFDAQDTNFLSGLLEGLGLDEVAAKYVENRGVERQKEEYVTKFMDENPAAQVLTPETARAAAEEEFRMKREGTMPQGTQTVEPMGKEGVLEQAEITQNSVELDKQLTADVAGLKTVSEENLPLIKELQDLNEQMLIQLQIIAGNIGNMGGSPLDALGGGKGSGGKGAPKKGGKAGIGGKILQGAKGLLGGIGRAAGPVGTAIAVGSTGVDIYQREKAVDAGTIDRETATKENTKDVAGTGTGLAGAAGGAKLGLMAGALAGPAAPVVAPVLGIIGGIAGFFLGDKIGRAATEAVQNAGEQGDLGSTMDGFTDPMGGVYSMPADSGVPVQSKSNQLDKQSGGGGVDIQQTTQNNVNAPTTVVNNNIKQNKSPSNDEPTFGRYTQQRMYP